VRPAAARRLGALVAALVAPLLAPTAGSLQSGGYVLLGLVPWLWWLRALRVDVLLESSS